MNHFKTCVCNTIQLLKFFLNLAMNECTPSLILKLSHETQDTIPEHNVPCSQKFRLW